MNNMLRLIIFQLNGNVLLKVVSRAFIRHAIRTYYRDATAVHLKGAIFRWESTFHASLTRFRDAILRTCHGIRLFFIRREHTHLVEFVPEETREKYTEVVTMNERGSAKLTPAFDQAIAAAKKAVEDAAAARAAQAAATARQGRGVGRRNRPQGGGGSSSA
jgi:hypothetical protein